MSIRRALIITGAAAVAAALLAQASAQPPEEAPAGEEQPAGEDEAAEETPEEIAARELCMETAAPGAHRGWSIREGRTCENSFAETCTVIRESDGAEFSHTCFAPLPPLPPLPGEDADDGATEGESNQ